MISPKELEYSIHRRIAEEHPSSVEAQDSTTPELMAELYSLIRRLVVVRMELGNRWIEYEREQSRLRAIAWKTDTKLKLDKIKTKKARLTREERKMKELSEFKAMLAEYMKLQAIEPDQDTMQALTKAFMETK